MELFFKRFIDLLDEEIPVSMVHTVTEQPLGSLMNDSYIMVHARKDLVDDDSPFLELEIFPLNDSKVRFIFAFIFPKNSIEVDQSEFEKKLKSDSNLVADKIIDLALNDFHYELFAENEWEIPENNAEIDQIIVEILEFIEEWMNSCGYKTVDI